MVSGAHERLSVILRVSPGREGRGWWGWDGGIVACYYYSLKLFDNLKPLSCRRLSLWVVQQAGMH